MLVLIYLLFLIEEESRTFFTQDIFNWIFGFAGFIAAIIGIVAFFKHRKEIDPDKVLEFINKTLEKVQIQLDLNNLPLIDMKIQELEKRIKILENKDVSINTATLIKMGNIEFAHCDYAKAMDYYNEALKQADPESEKENIGVCLGNIGLIYQVKCDFDRALDYHEKALIIHRDIGYKQGEASALGNIGLIYQVKGDLDRSLDYFEKALIIHKDIGYKQGEASDFGNIGLIYYSKGDFKLALEHHEEALKIDRDIGDKRGEANHLGNIGLVYKDKGETEEALKYLNKAITLLDNYNLVYGRDIIEKAINQIEDQKSNNQSDTP